MSRVFATAACALSGLAFALVAAACALPFPDYELEPTDPTTTTTTGAGGAGGSDAPGSNGMPCDSDDECLDGHCLPSNTGSDSVCCARGCLDMGEASCGTNGKCDAGGADCALYAAGTDCGEAACADGELTAQQCKAASCESGVQTPCGGGLDCADTTTCNETCKTGEECANPSDANPGAACDSGDCIQRPAGAPCDADSQCDSLMCGTAGVGHCCDAKCPHVGEACGPTDCDSSGDCAFATTDTACGPEPSCMSGNLATVFCNGDGVCSVESTQPCPGHLACEDATTCWSSCGSNDATGDERCPSGYWCDGSTCQQSSFDAGSACLRDGQCSSNDCTPQNLCTAAACDLDNDGYVRDDPHCVAGDTERDCDDNDARAYPGQTEFFDTPRSMGGYDFDCDTVEQPEHPTSCVCAGYALLVPAGPAGCGVTGPIRTCFQFFLYCGPNDTANGATQLCR